MLRLPFCLPSVPPAAFQLSPFDGPGSLSPWFKSLFFCIFLMGFLPLFPFYSIAGCLFRGIFLFPIASAPIQMSPMDQPKQLVPFVFNAFICVAKPPPLHPFVSAPAVFPPNSLFLLTAILFSARTFVYTNV